jgi:hypothetical protein
MFSSSSSLAVSESPKHEPNRHKSSGLFRSSKQHIVEKKMFGKKFKGKGKGMKSHFSGDMKSSGISPSVEEFDNMMSKISGSRSNKKKSMFSRKSFG